MLNTGKTLILIIIERLIKTCYGLRMPRPSYQPNKYQMLNILILIL